MNQDKFVSKSVNSFGFVYGDKKPGYHDIWHITSLKDIINDNLLEMISTCFQKMLVCRSRYDDFIKFNNCQLTKENKEKLELIKSFTMQSEHAYVIRKGKLKEEFYKL